MKSEADRILDFQKDSGKNAPRGTARLVRRNLTTGKYAGETTYTSGHDDSMDEAPLPVNPRTGETPEALQKPLPEPEEDKGP